MSREELEIYQKVKIELEKFSERFVSKLYETDNTLCYPYVYDSQIHPDNNTLYIITFRNDCDVDELKTIKIPLRVVYENNIDEYIKEIEKIKAEYDL